MLIEKGADINAKNNVLDNSILKWGITMNKVKEIFNKIIDEDEANESADVE